MKKQRALVFEDEGILAMMLDDMLHGLGYEIIDSLANGSGASDIVKTSMPDIIFMDVTLEDDVSGIAVAESIRAVSDVPIVFTTGHSDKLLLGEMSAVKSSSYVKKPYDIDELGMAIESLNRTSH